MCITNNGGMTYCRWADKSQAQSFIQDQTPTEFFQTTMEPLRQDMLAGKVHPGCSSCYQMDQYGKISGRQRQLLKIGVRSEQFEKTLASSPWVPIFQNQGPPQLPQDWQIDLGNHCNSACVFCNPGSSSRLATEHLQLGLITEMPKANWSENPQLLQKFLDTLSVSKHIQYLHFIGGETLITPAFATILRALIDTGLHESVTLGITTNLTVWPQPVIDLLCEFKQVHIGMSVEAFAPINDYVRWPGKLADIEQKFQQWLDLCKQKNWLPQLRTTPTVLSLLDLVSVHDRAWNHNIPVESCNFLQHPVFLRPSVLPMSMRGPIIEKFSQWLDSHQVDNTKVINTRNPHFAQAQVCQDLHSYIQYLSNEPDESYLLPELVKYLKLTESMRKNSVLNYRPEYEELFRTAGY